MPQQSLVCFTLQDSDLDLVRERRPSLSSTLSLEKKSMEQRSSMTLRTIQRKLLQPDAACKNICEEIAAIFQPIPNMTITCWMNFVEASESSRCCLLGTDSWFCTGSRSRRCESWRFGSKNCQTFSDYYSWECFSFWPRKMRSMFLMGAGDIQTLWIPHLSVYYLVWHSAQ